MNQTIELNDLVKETLKMTPTEIKVEEGFSLKQNIIKVQHLAITSEDFVDSEYKIYENNNVIFEVYHSQDTPEDNTLFRNFNDCYNVMCLLEKFYNYGKEGAKITFGMKDTE